MVGGLGVVIPQLLSHNIRRCLMKQWQFNLGISGSLLWVVVINNLDYVLETGSQSLNDLCTGYILGFITSLVFFLFWERVHGRIELFCKAESTSSKFFTGFMYSFLSIMALTGVAMSVFLSLSWHFNLSFSIASVAVAQGLTAIIKDIDYRHTS